MPKYCAEHYSNGQLIAETFNASDWDTAELYAMAKGWQLLGEMYHEQDCSDAVTAMIQRNLYGLTQH